VELAVDMAEVRRGCCWLAPVISGATLTACPRLLQVRNRILALEEKYKDVPKVRLRV
jgi:hypothetical protein